MTPAPASNIHSDVTVAVRVPTDASVIEEVYAGTFGSIVNGRFVCARELEDLIFQRLFDGAHRGGESAPAPLAGEGVTCVDMVSVPSSDLYAFKATLADLCLERWTLRYQAIQAAHGKGDGAYWDVVEMECLQVEAIVSRVPSAGLGAFALPVPGEAGGGHTTKRISVLARDELQAQRILALIPASVRALVGKVPHVHAITSDGSGPAGVMTGYGELLDA